MSTIDALFGGPWGPVLIFSLRIFDVSLSTLRIVLSVRNARWIVPFLGFFEVLIWLFAAGNAIRHLESGWHVFGYASGFATGTWVGLWIEQKLAFGWATVQVISREKGAEMAAAIRNLGFGVTEFAGQGRFGSVEVVQSVLRRREVPALLAEVDQWDPEAFVMIDEPRVIQRGWMYTRQPIGLRGRIGRIWTRADAAALPET